MPSSKVSEINILDLFMFGWKVSDIALFFEDGTKVKMRSEIKSLLSLLGLDFCTKGIRIKNTKTTYLKRKYIFKIILQNICYYLGTYKIGIYEIEITQKNDWSNYYLDLYDELAIKIDQNRKCGPN